jgi:hypothetical protein
MYVTWTQILATSSNMVNYPFEYVTSWESFHKFSWKDAIMENSRPIYLEIFHILCDVLATLTCYAMLFKNRMQHEILIEKEVLEGSSPPTFLTLFSYFNLRRKWIVTKDMTLDEILEFYTARSSVCLNITSKFRTVATFKSFVKRNSN